MPEFVELLHVPEYLLDKLLRWDRVLQDILKWQKILIRQNHDAQVQGLWLLMTLLQKISQTGLVGLS
ncbi:hypothetical protein D3C76_1585160 [compost metagenome]